MGSVLPALAGEMTTVVYPIVFGDIDALEAFADVVVGEDGHVVQDRAGRRLIVVTTVAKHAALDQVFGTADAQVGNVRIQVQFRETGRDEERVVALRPEGEVIFGPGGPRGDFGLRAEWVETRTDTRADTRQTLLAASGREATLRVGERVPYIDWITEYGWHGGYTETRVQWQDVGAFLAIQPTILADGHTVHVRLTPELRGQVDGQPQRVRFAEMATEVLVGNGQTLSIGGLTQDSEFYSRFLIGIDRSGTTRSLDIELTPFIEPVTPVRR